MAEPEKQDLAQMENANPQAPQGYRYYRIDPVIEKRTVRKLDLNVMPLVMGLCT
jgi:hypothetical protein